MVRKELKYIRIVIIFFFKDTATTEIYTYGHTLSRRYALPIARPPCWAGWSPASRRAATSVPGRRWSCSRIASSDDSSDRPSVQEFEVRARTARPAWLADQNGCLPGSLRIEDACARPSTNRTVVQYRAVR